MGPDEVAWLTAAEVVDHVRKGRLDRQEVVRCHLERINRLNPRLHAYLHVDESAAAGEGPLGGATLGVKDTQPVRGMPWTFGSRRWAGRIADEDAIPVQRARAAGLTILGKTSTPELAASVGTVNELIGATQNPWRQGFTPGGSSGGSGAAVAAGLCTIAFGDDMGGSVRIPASCCGVVGLRPTIGRVPEEQPDPVRLSVRGPLARSVADLRLAFGVMSAEAAPTIPRSKLRVAVVEWTPAPIAPACEEACVRAAEALAAAGHELRPARWDPLPVARAYQTVRPASLSTMPGEPEEYGEAVQGLIARGRRITARDYLAALAEGQASARHLHRLLEEHDAILTPTLGRLPAPIAESPPFLSEQWVGYTQFVLPVSFAELPAVSVPAGLADGLPVGVQLVGRPRAEWQLLALAEELESTPGFGFQRPPDL